jgi:hypothetical protein
MYACVFIHVCVCVHVLLPLLALPGRINCINIELTLSLHSQEVFALFDSELDGTIQTEVSVVTLLLHYFYIAVALLLIAVALLLHCYYTVVERKEVFALFDSELDGTIQTEVCVCVFVCVCVCVCACSPFSTVSWTGPYKRRSVLLPFCQYAVTRLLHCLYTVVISLLNCGGDEGSVCSIRQ